jgi:hypothetical protein
VEGIARLFQYLDRFHTVNNDLILPLRDKGFAIYKETVFDDFAGKARTAALNLIQNEREEEDVDRNLLRRAVHAFVEMGQLYQDSRLTPYRNQLENKLVEHARTFYRKKSRTWISQDSTPTYLRKAETMLTREKSRVEAYLHKSTLEPLTNACYEELLKQHQSALLDKKTGVKNMLANNSTEDLTRMYSLYSKKVDMKDLEPISTRFHDFITEEGKRIVAEAQAGGIQNDPRGGLVARLIDLHDQYSAVVTSCFDGNTIFQVRGPVCCCRSAMNC